MTFLDHFESVRSCGNGSGQWMARCQAHDDRNHSLSIGRGDGKWLLFCQAGCWVGQVLACHGLDWNDLFDEDGERNGNGRVNLGRVREERRPRLDMSGEALLPPQHIVDYWQQQLSDTIAQRLFELKGWSRETLDSTQLGWDGVRLVLPVFNRRAALRSLVRYLPGGDPKTLAIGPRSLYGYLLASEDLWLVEGEPDAISMFELDAPAVAIPGVGKWDETWPERFQGRRVTVCFDCDRQGREAACKWSSALDAAGVENRVVDLAPGVDDGYDIGDALANATRAGRVPELKAFLANLHAEAWS
jgi:Toprim domain